MKIHSAVMKLNRFFFVLHFFANDRYTFALQKLLSFLQQKKSLYLVIKSYNTYRVDL